MVVGHKAGSTDGGAVRDAGVRGSLEGLPLSTSGVGQSRLAGVSSSIQKIVEENEALKS